MRGRGVKNKNSQCVSIPLVSHEHLNIKWKSGEGMVEMWITVLNEFHFFSPFSKFFDCCDYCSQHDSVVRRR